MNYLDSHCHINGEEFIDDLDAVLNNMLNNHVTKAMLVCVNLDDYKRSVKIKKDGIDFKIAIGVYPEDTNISEDIFKEYYEKMKEVDAIGEIGLDYHWYPETKEKQKELFISQIKIANQLNKPIIVHSREAMGDCFEILKEHHCRGVLHCYSGSSEMAKELSKMGYYISLGGPLTWKNAKEPIEVVKNVPIDKLLIETDSPYLTPVPNRGKRNEPSNVIYVAKKMAEILNIEEETLLKQINLNYDNLFNR
ncbi:MAG: TatD family hydrolase [Erysipelotrichaceae bacterium]|nr:TatD family hydrolase [Erysipelotrichaceae bacterium]